MSDELHADTVHLRFNAAAPTYDDHARVQRIVAQNLMRMIQPSDSSGRLLEIGCGSGQMTKFLLERFPNARIDAIDVSSEMIRQARDRLTTEPRLKLMVADAKSFQSPIPYERVISNCSLHWVDPMLDGFYNIASLMERGALLIVSVMLHGTLGELLASRLRVAPDKPPMGRLPRMNEVIDSLSLCGFEVREDLEATELEFYPSSSDFLRAIHELGVTGGLVSRSAVPLNRGELRQLAEDYEAAYYEEGRGVRASFVVGYVIAAKL